MKKYQTDLVAKNPGTISAKIIKASIAADKVPAPDFAAIKPAATPIPASTSAIKVLI